MWNEGPKAFTAGEALAAKRRVKIKSGTTTTPPEVVYADAGEDFIGVTEYAVASGDKVSIKLNSSPGTFEVECTVSSAIARGTVLYGAADGKVSDASSGTAQGISLQAGVTGQHLEVAFWNVKSTTAGTVSVADAGGIITGTTVEAALAEAFQHIQSAQKSVVIPLGSLMLEDGTAIGKFADGDSATPGFNQVSNKEVVLRWNNHSAPGNVALTIPLPQDLDASADVVVHMLAAMSGSTDSPEITTEAYFNAGDTDCAGTDDEIDGGTTLTEYTNTILAADVPANPSVLTVIFSPKDGELGTDDCLVYAVWLEYTGITLTS